MPAIAPNSFVAVTGITGYIGSHVGLAALQAGHRVRGTVRSLERAKSLKDAYVKQGIQDIDSRLEFVIVDDLLSVDQYLRALEGVDGVLHVALLMEEMGNHSFVNDAPVVATALLRAAKQVPSVKRIVFTSSTAAMITPPASVNHPLSGLDWNDAAVQAAEQDIANSKTDTAPWITYGAGKTKAEKAVWRFLEEEKPQFDLVSILPNTNYGPILYGKAKTTSGWLESILKNDGGIMHVIPPQWWLDVRDDGRLHVLCLTEPSVTGKRVVAAATPVGWNQILSIFRKHFPSLQLPEDVPGPQGGIDTQEMDNKVATDLLGGWIGLEQSVVDFAKSMGY